MYAHMLYIQIAYTLHSSERLWQNHLPLKRLLAENGHKQRGECEQPPHLDPQCEPGRAEHRLL